MEAKASDPFKDDFEIQEEKIPVGKAVLVETHSGKFNSGARANFVPVSVDLHDMGVPKAGHWDLAGPGQNLAQFDITMPPPDKRGYGTMLWEVWLWCPSFGLFDVSEGALWTVSVPAGGAVQTLAGFVLDKAEFLSQSVYFRTAARVFINKLANWTIQLQIQCNARRESHYMYGFQRCIVTYTTVSTTPALETECEESVDDSLSDVSFMSDV